MHYFLGHHGNQLAAFVLISCGTLAVAAIVGVRAKREGERGATQVARAGAVGFALAAFAATTMNGVGSGGGFQWTIGEAGLRTWSADLARFPETVQSVLLVGNVAVYVPLGICLAIGWPRRRLSAIIVAALVPISVEVLQSLALRGVGSSDDIILNLLGIMVGWSVGVLASACIKVGRRT